MSHVCVGMYTPVVAIGDSSKPECKRMGSKRSPIVHHTDWLTKSQLPECGSLSNRLISTVVCCTVSYSTVL